MLVRDYCHGGVAKKSTMTLNPGVSPETSAFPCETENYITLNKQRTLTATKLAHLTQICTNFIPEDRWTDHVEKR